MSEPIATTAITLDPTVAAFDADDRVDRLGRTHFIGIGGAGMSVLAEMLHEQGVSVDGSDREPSAKTERLQSLGIPVQFGQRAENVAGAATVVYSSAIKPDNPEIVAAHSVGARIVHRSDILALLMAAKRAVTVAGAHGKTTTSSLLAHILVQGGTGELADPSYAIGGSIQSADGMNRDGGHAGRGSVLVAEADESDGSFRKYHPDIAIVTNAEPDHLDHYGTGERYHAAFVDHVGHARGSVVMCADDEGCLTVLRALDPDTAARTVVYTTQDPTALGELNGAAVVRIESEQESAGDGHERFVLRIPASLASDERENVVPVELSIPGLHNARNAAAAIIAAGLLGMPYEDAAHAATSFLGAARRFQICGAVDGVTVIDDYAHHPTEIAALLDATRRRYPRSRIHVLFQPHLFSRTKFFARQFAEALSKADDVIVSGIFPARERQEDFPTVSAATIVEAAKACATGRTPHIEAVEDMREGAAALAGRAQAGDVVLTVGAGDVNRMDAELLRLLEARDGGMTR